MVFSAVLDTPTTVAAIVMLTSAGAVGYVGLAMLVSEETPAGPSTTMVLNVSLFNIGAAAGAGIGGMLLATGGFDAIVVALPLFALTAVLLVW